MKSHYTVVRPILLKYGFGATFFITEGFDFRTNKKDYMSWDEIAQLHKDGFEIGNHTRDHLGIKAENVAKLTEQIEAINKQCKQHGIPRTVSFAWPGNSTAVEALPKMRELGIRFARRGGAPEYPYDDGRGFAYEPGLDHPLLVPSAGDARPGWKLADFTRAAKQARHGRIAVFQFHGVPDLAHDWVNTPRESFEAYMKYLAINDYQVIAMRDLAKYVDSEIAPRNPQEVIEDRQQVLAGKRSRDNFRRPQSERELRYWLENMAVYHRYTAAEMSAATGLSADEIKAALAKFNIDRSTSHERGKDDPLLVLPYPGGRHPRVGFLDGAIRPQRETKISVFAPWKVGGYFVVDVPEAIWWTPEDGRELLYLAHTHVPTHWSKRSIELKPLEWERHDDGALSFERKLPNRVTFAGRVKPTRDAVLMELSITNGTEQKLTGLRVQNCIMFKAAPGFERDDGGEEGKVKSPPYVARRAVGADRWIITAWEPNQRVWTNPPCPCMHSDPQFPDCAPGETQRVRGALWFYQGDDVEREIQRLDKTVWRRGQ